MLELCLDLRTEGIHFQSTLKNNSSFLIAFQSCITYHCIISLSCVNQEYPCQPHSKWWSCWPDSNLFPVSSHLRGETQDYELCWSGQFPGACYQITCSILLILQSMCVSHHQLSGCSNHALIKFVQHAMSCVVQSFSGHQIIRCWRGLPRYFRVKYWAWW